MHRKAFLAYCVCAALGAAPAFGQTVQEKFIQQLKTQGFTELTITKTWLGRTRIVARSKTHQREVIYSTRTGEILRDYWEDLDGSDKTSSTTSLLDPKASSNATDGSNSGGSGGSGGSGSGSGGGGINEQTLRYDFNYLTGGQKDEISF